MQLGRVGLSLQESNLGDWWAFEAGGWMPAPASRSLPRGTAELTMSPVRDCQQRRPIEDRERLTSTAKLSRYM